MTSIQNQTDRSIPAYVEASLTLHPHLTKHPNLPLVYLKEKNPHVIPILSGGGSGHEPAHMGYVGDGMLTGALYGQLFTPPKKAEILEAIRFLDQGQGVFIIIKNFPADLLEFRSAIQEARQDGHQVSYILSHDDISIENKQKYQIRGRGLAGTILLHKILGHAAQAGANLQELENLGLTLSSQIATIGFASKTSTLFEKTRNTFTIPENHISYGIGIHGEEGYRLEPFESSEQLANEILNKLRLHFHWKTGDSYILLVNNLGTTSELEMGVFTHDLLQLLDIQGIHPTLIKNGRFMTSLDMAGISVTLCPANDYLEALRAPTNAFAW